MKQLRIAHVALRAHQKAAAMYVLERVARVACSAFCELRAGGDGPYGESRQSREPVEFVAPQIQRDKISAAAEGG